MDAFTTALTLLSRRELSTRQLRERLARRGIAPDEIDRTIARLTEDGTLDDRRVAAAKARTEAAIKGRGRRRVQLQVRQLGVDGDVADAAIDEVYADLDEDALLERAIDRRLKGAAPDTLDAHGRARLVRYLVGQGFELPRILARLRRRGAAVDE